MIWECSQCNQPVNQPCCKLETAKLKKGVSPGFCPLQQSHVAGWKKIARSNWLNGGTEAGHDAGQPQQPQGEIALINEAMNIVAHADFFKDRIRVYEILSKLYWQLSPVRYCTQFSGIALL